jgi:hypothetical protein
MFEMITNSCLQDFAEGKEAQYVELLAEASNLREEVHRLKMVKETSDTLMHGVFMAFRSPVISNVANSFSSTLHRL